MKRYFTILACAAVAFVGCQNLNTVPEFEESESFASFPTATFGVNENVGQLVIPVSIASIKPVKTVVSYEIVDGTAKAGVNFKDTNPDAVLSFDGETREQNIVIDILELPGEYTGDLGFSIKLTSATGLKISAENNCGITMFDLDHPLAAILGTYTGTAVDVGGDVVWELTLAKDLKDVNVLWCDGICPLHASNKSSLSPVYANVTKGEDGSFTLSFPCGQEVGEYNGNGMLELAECYIDGGYMVSFSSSLIFTQTATGFESEYGMGLVNDYLYYNGFLLGKKTDASYKVVWTKK